MGDFSFNGIDIYNGDESSLSSPNCSVLGLELECCVINQKMLWADLYSKISILIFDKLGFDLSTKEGYKISKETKNRNKVVCVWNNMVNEFNDVETITKKLKEPNFELGKYLEGYSEDDKKKYTVKQIEKKSNLESNNDTTISNENDTTISNENSSIFKGTAKQIELFEDKLVIGPQKEGLNNFISSFDGVTEIDVFYEDIRSVTVFKVGPGALASALFSGGNMNKIQVSYLRIFLKGSEGNTPSHQFHPASDPYTIIFNLNQVTDPDKFKSKIDKLISQFKSSNRNSQSQPISSADELEKFSNLLEKGIITEEEFQAKKKQILGL